MWMRWRKLSIVARNEEGGCWCEKNPLISTSEDPAKGSGLYTQLDLASGMRNGSCFDWSCCFSERVLTTALSELRFQNWFYLLYSLPCRAAVPDFLSFVDMLFTCRRYSLAASSFKALSLLSVAEDLVSPLKCDCVSYPVHNVIYNLLDWVYLPKIEQHPMLVSLMKALPASWCWIKGLRACRSAARMKVVDVQQEWVKINSRPSQNRWKLHGMLVTWRSRNMHGIEGRLFTILMGKRKCWPV